MPWNYVISLFRNQQKLGKMPKTKKTPFLIFYKELDKIAK